MKKSMIMAFNVVFVFITLLCAFLYLVYDNKIFSGFQFVSMGLMFLIQYIINKNNLKSTLGKSQIITSVLSIAVGLGSLVSYFIK